MNVLFLGDLVGEKTLDFLRGNKIKKGSLLNDE